MLSSSISVSAIDKELKSILSEKEIKRIESAEKLISKGDAVIEETKELDNEIEALKNADGRIKTRKINKLNKKVNEIKVKASVYYQDGYKKYIDVLDDYLKDIEKEEGVNVDKCRDEVKDLEKKAKKLYNKAENLSSPDKMIEFIELAQENQNKAIDNQIQFITSLEKKPEPAEVIEEPLLVEQAIEDTTSIVETEIQPELEVALATPAPAAPATSASLAPAIVPAVIVATNDSIATQEITPIIEEEPILAENTEEVAVLPIVEEPAVEPAKPNNPDIYLTIQFMADKQKATEAQIKSKYAGNKEVIEKHINNWYKYSIGKYQSLEDAKAAMQSENIKGFIVAYNKDQRISVKEATSLLNQ